MQNADLQPTSDAAPDHIAVDGTVIQVNDKRRRLYATVGPETNEFPHVWLFPTRTTQLTVLFLRELQQHVPVTQATILVDDAYYLKATLSRLGLRFQISRRGNWNAIERISREVKRHTYLFSNTFAMRNRRRQNGGCKSSPSGGIMLKLTRPNDSLSVNLLSVRERYQLRYPCFCKFSTNLRSIPAEW